MTEDAETYAAAHYDADASEHRQEESQVAPSKPKARERGRMRRRLRALSRIREALLLDLGATVWELHRHGRREPELLQAKAADLAAVDDEVRGLAEALERGEGVQALVGAGVTGACGHCGSLLTPGSRYCPACGSAVGMNGSLAETPPQEESEPDVQTEVVEAPLPGPPGVSPRPAGAPSVRRRMGRRLRGTRPR